MPITAGEGLAAHRLVTAVEARLQECRTGERIIALFFVYSGLLTFAFDLPMGRRILSAAIPLLIGLFIFGLPRFRARWVSVARDFLLPLYVLAAYWQMGWFAGQYSTSRQAEWLVWDRQLLDGAGWRNVIESGGRMVPELLELAYLLLYLIPPICILMLYRLRAGNKVERFSTTFVAGTLAAYALLPLIPVASPRVAYPGLDLPQIPTLLRGINTWMLDRMDIATSVFPSGHVAVAFSCAFGFRRALPEQRVVFAALLVTACCVFTATVYGRYHYAADGLVSVLITLGAWGACEAYDRLG